MPRASLTDFFKELAFIRGEFLLYDDGYTRQSRSYSETARAARAFARRLADAGIRQGDRIVFWSENRPEWIVALWGSLISGVVVVPLDFRSPSPFVARVAAIVEARLWLVGDDVDGDAATLAAGPVPVWKASRIAWQDDGPMPEVTIGRDDTAQIIFTSGATADPKGVVMTHGNILANIEPIEHEIAKYRGYGRPFFPLRFLDLLPLSHMFGQSMATFIPPLLPGTAMLMAGYSPAEIIRAIRAERISVLVCVPRMLELLRAYLLQAAPSADDSAAAGRHWTQRWWHHRDAHRLFGPKFWCVVVGAAPLEAELEAFWSRLGFLVIQGYGLTETAPVVTLNHPFAARAGSVGRPLKGVEVKVAPDGEILVRGGNVTRGYYNAPEATHDAFEDGWLKTGDVGGLNESGHLFVLGRKKEMIVTPDGLNVFPADVEHVLDSFPGIRESVVVGVREGAQERVHAVVVADEGVDLDAVVAAANAVLAPHQRVRLAVRWPGPALPRTEGTRKLKRLAVREWLSGTARTPLVSGTADAVETLVGKYTHGRTLRGDTTLDDLGLGSLDRVELMVSLERHFGVEVDEQAFASAHSIDEVRALVSQGGDGGAGPAPGPAMVFPSWNFAWPVRVLRCCLLDGLVLPIVRRVARARVTGVEHLASLRGPVIFAANHQSHLDTPVILAVLPWRLRHRVAPAMAKEYFAAYFHPAGHAPAERRRKALFYFLAAAGLNAFPLPQREAGSVETFRYMGTLAGRGISILIFPEGVRTDAGEFRPFKAGVGMMAARLRLPVVPVRLEHLDRVLHKTWSWPRPGGVRVSFGSPEFVEGYDFAEIARRIEQRVHDL